MLPLPQASQGGTRSEAGCSGKRCRCQTQGGTPHLRPELELSVLTLFVLKTSPPSPGLPGSSLRPGSGPPHVSARGTGVWEAAGFRAPGHSRSRISKARGPRPAWAQGLTEDGVAGGGAHGRTPSVKCGGHGRLGRPRAAPLGKRGQGPDHQRVLSPGGQPKEVPRERVSGLTGPRRPRPAPVRWPPGRLCLLEPCGGQRAAPPRGCPTERFHLVLAWRPVFRNPTAQPWPAPLFSGRVH